MKAVSGIDASVVREQATRSSPIKVGMHVLGIAGTDVRVMHAAIALVEAGFAVTVVDIDWKNSEPVEEDICGARVGPIFTPNWYTSRRFRPWFLIQAVWLLIRSTLLLMQTSADVYHAHDAKALPAGYLAARLRRKPLIFDSHELPLSEEIEIPRWRGLIRLFSGLLAIMVPRCAGVISVSPSVVPEIHKRYSGPDPTLIRNVPVYRVVPRSSRLLQYLGLPPEVRIALYQGSLKADRGLARLIRAASFLERDSIIVLMGPEAEGTQPQVLAYLADPAELRFEVEECRRILEHQLGHPVGSFAYPFGKPEHIGDNGLRAVQQAGYDWAVTTLPGFNTPQSNPYLLRRRNVGVNQHWLIVAAETAGVWDFFSQLYRVPLTFIQKRLTSILQR